jgi:hypothetical protein
VISRDYFHNPFKVPHYDRAMHVASWRVGVGYVANVAAGLVGLSMVNVPMFFCIRRLVSPTILLYEYVFLRRVAEPSVQGAVGVIMLGTLIAGWDTLQADLVGYGVTFLNNLCSAFSSVAQKQFSDATKLGALGTLYYTSLTALPLSLALAVAKGELQELAAFPSLGDPRFWLGFVTALSLGPILTYSSILCTTHNSPLAMSITGNVKDLATTILGAFLFPGFVATLKNVGGLGLTFLGAGAYTMISFYKGLKGAAAGGAEGAKASKPAPAAAEVAKAEAESHHFDEEAAVAAPVQPKSPSVFAGGARGRVVATRG